MAGTLFVVATPIGNLEDISARALRVLREVSVIAAEDTRHTGHLLQRFGVATRTTSFHEHSVKGKAAALVDRLKQGESIALVSDAGTPTVSDPGVHLINLARQAGVRVETVPGPAAVTAALSIAGFDGNEFTFLGFPPTKGTARKAWFERLAAARNVTPLAVFYEAPHRLQATLDEVGRRFQNPTVAVARELTKIHEEVRIGAIHELGVFPDRGEYTVVIDFGHKPAIAASEQQLTAAGLAREFGEVTKNGGLTRRQAIASLSRKYGLQARAVYSMLEQAKDSPV